MQVQLYIPKLINRRYLHHIFEVVDDRTFKIKRTHDFGKLLCSMLQFSNFKPPEDLRPDTVYLIIPDSAPVKSVKSRFVFLSVEAQLRLNDFLEVLFNIDFDRYFLAGLKLKLQHKDIIRAFIDERRLAHILFDNETLKKREYRSRKNLEVEIEKKLFWKVQYCQKIIQKSLLSDNTLNHK